MVSIIIPVYKTEKYIRNCLDSILAQTYTHWEAILVDDGSPDDSGLICDEYAAKDMRFRVIHQKNRGVVNARNNGINVANGEYLAFIDSDDYIEDNMLEEMVFLAKNKQLDIVWCDVKEIHPNCTTYEPIMLDNNNKNISNLLRSSLPGYLCNKLINKAFWEKCNIITDENSVVFEDTFISLQLLANNPNNGIINKPFYNYIKTNINATTHKDKSSIIVRAEGNIVNIYEYLKKTKLLEKYHKEFTALSLKLKIEMLQYDIKKAKKIFPFSHMKLQHFKFPLFTSIFYWLGFNWGVIGELLFKIRFSLLKNEYLHHKR
ncbi:MAG: glycosyltransferase family 2 protein [Bacteroidaceae bacterium]|nr:glycosyltransferase family 2 protein [Bacteroidaceae bacterium]